MQHLFSKRMSILLEPKVPKATEFPRRLNFKFKWRGSGSEGEDGRWEEWQEGKEGKVGKEDDPHTLRFSKGKWQPYLLIYTMRDWKLHHFVVSSYPC